MIIRAGQLLDIVEEMVKEVGSPSLSNRDKITKQYVAKINEILAAAADADNE
jgi:hypothetical protein